MKRVARPRSAAWQIPMGSGGARLGDGKRRKNADKGGERKDTHVADLQIKLAKRERLLVLRKIEREIKRIDGEGGEEKIGIFYPHR